jgi:hypothetical protein
MTSPQKYRNELKYVIDAAEARVVAQRLGAVMAPDPHADANGGYRVTSVYFDDIYLRAYRQKVAGYPDRLKLRVRVYGGDGGRAVLEAKVKRGGRGAKESMPLSGDECGRLLAGDYGWLLGRDEPAAKDFFMRSRVWAGLKPVVAVDYYRKAFAAHGGIRVTLDEGLRGADMVCAGADPISGIFGGAWTPADGDARGGAYWRDALGGKTVLEVKCGAFVPQYISDLFSEFGFRSQAVSKYVLCMDKTKGVY